MTNNNVGERWARLFHDKYEGLAPSFGYETRTDMKIFIPDSPNGKLMQAVCSEIMNAQLDEVEKLIHNAENPFVLEDGRDNDGYYKGFEKAGRTFESLLQSKRVTK